LTGGSVSQGEGEAGSGWHGSATHTQCTHHHHRLWSCPKTTLLFESHQIYFLHLKIKKDPYIVKYSCRFRQNITEGIYEYVYVLSAVQPIF
jgi:hypothetical protein